MDGDVIEEVVAFGQQPGAGVNMPDMFGPGGVGFDPGQFSGIGSNYANMFGGGAGFDPSGYLQPKAPATDAPATFLDRLRNIKDKDKRRAWAKRFFGNILRMNPATRSMMMVVDLAKAIKEGGGQGILGALGQMGMQRLFGRNTDVARGIFGAASGQMTPGQALGGVAMGRGMQMGMNNLMKNIYKQYGMRGVQIAMPLMETILKGQGQGKGPGGP